VIFVRIDSASKLERAIFKTPSIQVVSFDVFDTLVQRTIPHPDLIKIPAAKQIRRNLAARSINLDVEKLLSQRLQAEQELRQRARTLGQDPECRIDDVFRAWLSMNALSPLQGVVDELLRVELQAELSVVYPRKGMAECLENLKARNFRLVYVSDMYLRKWMIEQLLEKCGLLELFDAGYVSCEAGKGKYSGKLIQQVIEDQCVLPRELLHVGDRYDVDIQGAARASVLALKFADPAKEAQHSLQSQINVVRRRSPFWHGASWGGRNIATKANRFRCEHDRRYQLGYEYLGPLFCNFIHRVILELEQEGINLVLFNSREGFLFLELYDRLSSALTGTEGPRAIYSYLTRKSIYAASLHAFGRREVDMGFHTISPTLRNMFIRFSLPIEEMAPVVKRAGFNDLDQELHHPHGSRELSALIQDVEFLEIVKRQRIQCADQISDYLAQLGFWEYEKVAIVDVGWNGTVQEALATAFSDCKDVPVLHGYYMALLDGKPLNASNKSIFHGVYHDYRVKESGTFFSRYRELFEFACRAPHPTVVGFERNSEGFVKPVFKDHNSLDFQMERRDDALISALQVGILDYCEDYVRSVPFHEKNPEAFSDYIQYKVDRLLRFPTKAEAAILSSFSHSEDFGQSLVHIPRRSLTEPDETAEPTVQLVRQRVLWREGRFRNLPIPALNLIFNFCRLAKTRRY